MRTDTAIQAKGYTTCHLIVIQPELYEVGDVRQCRGNGSRQLIAIQPQMCEVDESAQFRGEWTPSIDCYTKPIRRGW